VIRRAGGYAPRMPTIERSISIAAAPDAAFAYLSDVHNLPRYFPDITAAEPRDGDHVHVAAKVPDGSTQEGEAEFSVDEASRRIEWSSERDTGYHGWLEVAAEGEGTRVDLGLTMHHDDEDDSIGRTLQTIKQQLEG
jgi:uncharacterized membrane protein